MTSLTMVISARNEHPESAKGVLIIWLVTVGVELIQSERKSSEFNTAKKGIIESESSVLFWSTRKLSTN